jgi:hypothetical protein
MNLPRVYAAGMPLPNGLFMVIGGQVTSGETATCEIYNSTYFLPRTLSPFLTPFLTALDFGRTPHPYPKSTANGFQKISRPFFFPMDSVFWLLVEMVTQNTPILQCIPSVLGRGRATHLCLLVLVFILSR